MRGHPPSLRRATSALVGATFVLLATLVPATGASALAPSPTPSSSGGAGGGDANNIGPATAGKQVCALPANGPDAVTGMVATDQGIYAVEGGDTEDPASVIVWTINATTCAASSKNYGFNPVDPQDLALGSDGALWIGDIGDGISGQSNTRERLAFEQVTIGQSPATPFRALYPTSGKFDAEAMILDKDDSPIIFARTAVNGKVPFFKPSKKMAPDSTSNLPALTKLGDFTPQSTGTDTPLGAVGNLVVTGAAKSPDGSKVVIRTYSDAYEFTIGADGDIAKAITSTQPNITRLPNEAAGRAITYSADGKSFLTLSATAKSPLLSYTPYVPQANDPGTGGGSDNNEGNTDANSGSSWFAKLSLSQLTRIVAAVGAVGLVLAIAGIIGIRRARKRRREEEEYDDYDDDYDESPRRRGGRGRGRDDRDDRGYGSDGYDNYGDQGYADQGYGSYQQNGYAGAGAGYGSANGYDANGYGANGYGYGGQDYAQSGYGDQGGYAGGAQYGGGGGQAGYGYDQYGGQGGYGGDQYGGYDQYGGQGGYGGDQYGGQGGYGGQPHGGYEDDFDPLDPRRR